MMAGQHASGAATAIDGSSLEKISLAFSAQHLPKANTFGTTDPFLSIFVIKNGVKELVGHTEVAMDNYHPHWGQHFVVDYNFEKIQEYCVEVRHKAANTAVSTAGSHKFLGSFTFTNGSLMMSPGQKLVARLSDGMKKGMVIVRGESVKDTRDLFTCHIMASKLARMNGLGLFSKSDPYMQISRAYDDGTFVVVYKTSHILKELNPKWPNTKIEIQKMCNGDMDARLYVEMLDYQPDGKHVHIGAFRTNMTEILQGKTFELIHKDKTKGMFYSNSGTVRFVDASIEKHSSLADFIMGGMEMVLNVAIDFTASNGEPHTPKSLHRVPTPGMPPNDYEKAISAVGSVIEAYNKEKQFAVYGFGAKLPGPNGMDTAVQHCFPVYEGASTVTGVAGIIQAYRDALDVVKLSGPTHFQPLIQNAGYLAQSLGCTQESQKYTVLLILTDGIVDDMQPTVAEIVKASSLPLSIIIVGIGNEDFSDMDHLDGDEASLKHGDVKAHRDIVQFVPFKKFNQKGPVALAQQVLAEVPQQLLKYMEMHHITPNPPPNVTDEQAVESGPPPMAPQRVDQDEPPPPAYDD